MHRVSQPKPAPLRHRAARVGFSLLELLVVISIIGAILILSGSSLRTSASEEVQESANDVLGLLRRARNVATRQNRAVVVMVTMQGGSDSAGQPTLGQASAYKAVDNNCPAETPPADVDNSSYEGLPLGYESVSFGEPLGEEAAAIAGLEPVSSGRMYICFQPNGRILNGLTGMPFPSSDTAYMAGDAWIDVQFNQGSPILVDGRLQVPVTSIQIPFNGLVRMEPYTSDARQR